MPGYSETPPAKKLAFKDGQRAWLEAMSDSVRANVDGYGTVVT